MKRSFYCIHAFLLPLICLSTFSQVLQRSRKTDWTIAGYRGTVPVYSVTLTITDFGGAGDNSTVNNTALQNAIAALNGENGIIYFPAGTYLFNSNISLRSGIVLKGDGAANTLLQFDLSGSENLITVAGSITADTVAITSIARKDSSFVTVDNTSLFHANDYVKLVQKDAGLLNDSWATGSVGQILHIENIDSNRIYFSSTLRKNYSLTDTPKIIRLAIAEGCGLECLKIKRLDATVEDASNIYFYTAANCWVRGVESDSCNFAHVLISASTNIEVTNSYFHGAFDYGDGGSGYGISCEYTSGECRFENNVFRHLRHSMLVQTGANGNVFDYNYSVQPYKSESPPFDLSGDIVSHGNYPYLNLFEGNIVQNIVVDASHGDNGPYNTFFRNRAESYGLYVNLGAGDSTNIIGNELTGTSFQHGTYLILGTGNFQYGNNKNGTILPAGTNDLSERSLLYNSTPSFWNSTSKWSAVGIPAALNSGTIPAKERANSSSGPVLCVAAIPVTYTFTGDGNWDTPVNWISNSVPPALLSPGSEIIIDPSEQGKAVLNIPYVINPGATLTIKPGKHFEVRSNLTFVK